MSLNEVIAPLLEKSKAEYFYPLKYNCRFTDGWKMSKGHCKKPSELQDFLASRGINVNMPHVTNDKNRYWINL